MCALKNETGEIQYVWLLYNYNVRPEEKDDVPYLYAVYKTLPRAIEDKKRLQEWQKKYAPGRKGYSSRGRVFILRKMLHD